MSYISESLAPGEKLIYETKYHWWIFFTPCFFIVLGVILAEVHSALQLVGILFLMVGGILFISNVIRYYSTEFGVTNRRVIIKLGLIRRNTQETLLPRVAEINVNQGVLGRILGFGGVEIQNTGGGKSNFSYIDDPLKLRENIQEQMDQALRGG